MKAEEKPVDRLVENSSKQMENGKEQWKTVATMIVVNLAFAVVNMLFKKALDGGGNHMVLVTYRLTIATVFLVPIAYYWERKSRTKLTGTVICYLFFGALTGLTLCQYFFLLGLKYTSVGFSCAFLNIVPVNTFLLAIPFGLEKVSLGSKSGRAKVLGAVICISGAILLTVYKGPPLTKSDNTFAPNSPASEEKTRKWVLGSILLIAGTLSWSSWFLIQAQVQKRYPCPYSSTMILMFFASVQSAILSLIIKRDASMWILKGKLEILTVLYTGIVGSGLSYVGMSWCVKRKGPVFTAAFTPFTQIFAMVFDISIIGSLIVILGLYVLLWGKSKEAAEKCGMKQPQQQTDAAAIVIKEEAEVHHNEDPEVQAVKPATTT
ncbi:WAT1-related protein At3g30340 [Linum perenne]